MVRPPGVSSYPTKWHNGWRTVAANSERVVTQAQSWNYVKAHSQVEIEAVIEDYATQGWEWVRTVEYQFTPEGNPPLEAEFCKGYSYPKPE